MQEKRFYSHRLIRNKRDIDSTLYDDWQSSRGALLHPCTPDIVGARLNIDFQMKTEKKLGVRPLTTRPKTSMVPLQRVRSPGAETYASVAYERLRTDIISGALQPGAKLLIRQLCDSYGIGLSPMREALNRVSSDGLVVQTDQRGFSVAALTEEDLEDITRVRCWANEQALRLSIANGDDAWEERLLIALHRMSRHPFPKGPLEPVSLEREKAHRNFHNVLIDACGSVRLIAFCEKLFDAADRYRMISRRAFMGRPPGRAEGHKAIMEAALGRDADEAVRLLKAHFTETLDFGREEIRKLNMPLAQRRAPAAK